MRKLAGIMLAMLLAISLSLLMIAPVAANNVYSATMIFEGSLTDNGDGTYTGTIPMTVGEYYVSGGDGESISTAGGFDVFAERGGMAYVEGMTPDSWTIGSDHDAYSETGPWGSWYDPDCADWDKYELELTADHWYLRYAPTDESPMSGTMDWDAMYAAETDPGTVADDHGGSNSDATEYTLGSAQQWGWHCGWGHERIPLEFEGFAVELEENGGTYRVKMTAEIPGLVEMQSETFDGSGSMEGSPTGGQVTIDADGEHTVITGEYGENPIGSNPFSNQGKYYDIYLDSAVNVTSMTVQFCPAIENERILYWNGAVWVEASNQTFSNGCITVTITDETVPALSDLTGTEFGQGFLPPVGGEAYPVNNITTTYTLLAAGLLITTGYLVLKKYRKAP